MKDILSKVVIVIGAIMFIGVILSKQFRFEMGYIMEPLMAPFADLKFYITIFILSIITGFYSTIIQKYTMDYQKLKYAQKVIGEYRKEYMDAMKQNNQFKLKQLEQKKQEVQRLQSEMMSMQLKPMGYTFIVTIPIFAWLWDKAVASYQVIYGKALHGASGLSKAFLGSINPNLYFVTVPFMGKIHIATPFLIFPWWLMWYLLCSILVGQIFRKVLKVGI